MATTALRSKLLRPLPSTSVRAFTSSTTCREVPSRSPALGDVTPDGASAFAAKQKQFREDMAAAKRKKEQAESQLRKDSYSHSDSLHVESTTVQDTPPAANPLGLGSLKINDTGEQRQSESDTTTKKSGKLSNLIYGTPEGRQMDQEMEQSFSQLLARGKYVHSIVSHDVKPDKVDEYVKTVGEWYPKVAANTDNKVNLVGSWRTEIGDCDTFVHIWEYQRYLGYHQSLHNISHHPEFPDFDRHLKTLINSKKVSIMQEFSFWPTTPPRKLGGVFELRSYTLHPGNLLEWETHWRKGLKARKEVMEGVGAWFVQIGDLNTVHHLWQFANLEERRLNREKSWSVEGWADTVHKTVPLIQTMESKIMVPMPWSPVG